MNLDPKTVDGVLVFDKIDLENDQDIVDFKNFWKSEFNFGQQLFFSFHRLEDLTEDDELLSIEDDLLSTFNEENVHFVLFLDRRRFKYLFKCEFQHGIEELILKFWKYFYGMEVVIPKEGVNFDSVCKYFDRHRDIDLYLRSFKAKGYADTVYLKGLGGDYLIKN